MRVAVVLACILVSVIQSQAASLRVRRQLVPREFANINIENYLKNDRAVEFQLKCIVYDGPCDRIGKYLKVTIPELLTNQCRNCDADQRMRAGRLVSHIQQKFPKQWQDAVKKFQGDGVNPDDAKKLHDVLGVKLDSSLVASSTEAPAAPTEMPAEIAATDMPVSSSEAPAPSSTAAAPAAVVSSTAAPAAPAPSSSVAPVVSTAAPKV